MARQALADVLEAGFNATAHLGLSIFQGAVEQGMNEGIVPKRIAVSGNILTFDTLPTMAAHPLGASPGSAIPPNTNVATPPGDHIPLNGLLELQTGFTLQSQQLTQLGNVNTVSGNAAVVVRPYWSRMKGLGFLHHSFAINLTASAPTNLPQQTLNLAQGIIQPQLGAAVISRLAALQWPLPDVDGLPVSAVEIFTDPAGGSTEIVLAFGDGGRASDLQPLLATGEDMAITVSSSEFDARVARETSDLPRLTRTENGELARLQRLSMGLGADQIRISGKLKAYTTPRAEVTFSGPLLPRVQGSGIDGTIKFEPGNIDVDVDVDDFFEIFVIGFTTLFTAGIGGGIGVAVGAGLGAAVGAGIGAAIGGGITGGLISGEIADAETGLRNDLGSNIGGTLARSLLRSYPSGIELAGRDNFMTRVSSVPWAGISAFEVLPEGFLLAGPSIAGIRVSPRRMSLTHVHKVNGSNRHYVLGKEFYLSRERAIELMRSGGVRVSGVRIVRGRTGPYLRDRRSRSELRRSRTLDNLDSLPTFRLNGSFPSADDVVPPENKRYRALANGTLRELVTN